MKQFNSDISILVVDDDAMVKNIVVEYLQAIGFKNIFAAKKSAQALHFLHENKLRFDLIISDWEMPEISGLTLLKAVRNNPHRRSTPFIMITSQRSMERFKISQAAQWAVDCYLMKPFRLDILRQRIFTVMGWDEKAS